MVSDKSMRENRRFEFLIVKAGLLYMKGITSNEKLLISDIMSFVDGGYWKSNKQISRMLNITENGAGNMVSKLNEAGVINRYFICMNPEQNLYRRILSITPGFYKRMQSVDTCREYWQGTQTADFRGSPETCKNAIPFDMWKESGYEIPPCTDGGDPHVQMGEIPPCTDGGDPHVQMGETPMYRWGRPPCTDGVEKTEEYSKKTEDIHISAEAAPACTSAPKKKVKTVFKAPTLEEIQQYVTDKGYHLSPEEFFYHYQMTGWKVGTKPMKNWKAAVSLWETRDKKKNYGGRPRSRWEEERERAGEQAARELDAAMARDQAEFEGRWRP